MAVCHYSADSALLRPPSFRTDPGCGGDGLLSVIGSAGLPGPADPVHVPCFEGHVADACFYVGTSASLAPRRHAHGTAGVTASRDAVDRITSRLALHLHLTTSSIAA